MEWVKVVIMLPNPLRQAMKLVGWCADITGRGTPSSPTYVEYLPLHLD